MLRKNYLIFVLMVTAVLFGSIAAFAQIAPPVTGRVVMKDANGKDVPVANALVEPYRTDINTRLGGDKTNKKGEFGFASFQIGATYALVVTGEGLDPLIIPGVQAGETNLQITVAAGKGNTLTEAEVRDQLATAAAGGKVETGPSEADKKKAEELAKETEKVTAKNEKTQEFNDSTDRLFKEGKQAFESKNYDLAISKFDEGYKLSTTFLGSAPGFLNAKGKALGLLAVDFFNKGVNAKDNKEVRADNYAKAVTTFSDAIDAFYESWTLLKNASEADKAGNSSYQSNRTSVLLDANSILGYAVQTEKVNSEKTDKVKELLEEYIKVETDKAKKTEANTNLAAYYRMSGNFDLAIAEYRKALTISADAPTALFGLGISLVSTGYDDAGNPKKPQLQEAANFLKRFVDSSPTSKKALKDATDTLELLKTTGITPKK